MMQTNLLSVYELKNISERVVRGEMEPGEFYRLEQRFPNLRQMVEEFLRNRREERRGAADSYVGMRSDGRRSSLDATQALYMQQLAQLGAGPIKSSGTFEPSTFEPSPMVVTPLQEIERLKSELISTSQSLNTARRELVEKSTLLNVAQEEVKKQAEYIQRVGEQACPYATVQRVAGAKTVIVFGGKAIEVITPKDKEPVSGQTVKVAADTMQILELVGDAAPTGEVVEVARIPEKGLCEIERQGATRAVYFAGELEEGDRVVLDDSGQVVLKNLGKAQNKSQFNEETGVTWNDIGGLEDAKAQMVEAIEAPIRHAEMFKRFGQPPIRGVLLYGAPGCGKTLLGKAAATALAKLHGESAKGAFFYVKGPELLSKWVGETESGIRKLFDAARRHKKKHGYPAIIFLDEADAVLGERGRSGFGLQTTTVPQFLSEMDGLFDSGAIVLLATNRPDTLDPAIVRDGRIDRRVKVTRPKQKEAEAIFLKHLAKRPLKDGAELIAQTGAHELFSHKRVLYRVKRASKGILTDKMTLAHVASGAMVAGIVERATSNAMKRAMAGGEEGLLHTDITAGVERAYNEAFDMNHDNELREFCEEFMLDFSGIEKARPNAVEK